MSLLITGCAGFIGFHLSHKYLLQGEIVIGIDNINDYYDPLLKYARLDILNKFKNFIFYKIDLENMQEMDLIFKKHKITKVVNLAAQAGVRYSLENPHAYIQSNINGFLNILEASRKYAIEHLIYASSSSVYGGNTNLPYTEDDDTSKPLAIYAATKKSNELMAHSYSNLYALKTTGLRFFTVYGPWGRPDMAFFSFTNSILKGEAIKIFNFGKMKRDFTYIEDIIKGVALIVDNKPATDDLYNIYNIGSANPIALMDYIKAIEDALGIKAIKEFLPMQKGDVVNTHADISKLQKDYNFTPTTSIEVGVKQFVLWYKDFYCTHNRSLVT